MSQTSIDYANGKRQPQQESKPKWNAQEKAALLKIRREAKAAGATLKSDGEGGLRPSLALGVFRRGKWRCANTDCPTPKKSLSLDHISGHAKEIDNDPGARNRRDLRKGIQIGHVNKLDALHVLCSPCHDSVHSREREIEAGKKPEPMRGDVSATRD
jgi:5-methylcytosine-specific restriction endonuclease McrA